MDYQPRRLFGRTRGSDDPEVRKKRRDYSRSTQVVILGLVIAAVGAVSAVWPRIHELVENAQQANTQQQSLRVQPAPTKNPPILITAVSGLDSSVGGGDLALPEDTPLAPSDLEVLKHRGSNPDKYLEWAIKHQAAAIAPAVSSITIVANWDEEVNIRNIEVQKACSPPALGTYLRTASEGGGATARIGLDLDAPEVIPQAIVSGASGPLLTKENYFSRHTLTLRKGETATISVWAFSTHQKCSFTLSIIVASKNGLYRVKVPSPPRFPNSVTPGFNAQGSTQFKNAYDEQFTEESGAYEWHRFDTSELAR